MKHQKVNLMIRIRKTGTKKRRYVQPVWTDSKRAPKLKPLFARVNGQPEHHPEGHYVVRYTTEGGKRTFENIGSDADVAVIKFNKLTTALAAKKAGIEIVEESARRCLQESVANFVAEKKGLKKHKTFLYYNVLLEGFLKTCNKASVEELRREDILNYIIAMKAEGQSDRTISNRVKGVKSFYIHHGLHWPLAKHDMPRYTEKIVKAYTEDEIQSLAAAASPEEYELLYFFLCSGGREKDVQFARYENIDFTNKTFYIQEDVDLGYTPKDREEARIPLPDFLIDILRLRKKRNSGSQLIFPTEKGEPNGHMLRIIKRLALRAGLNCGYCKTKPRKKKDGTISSVQTCDKYPVCSKWILHKWRKTFATYYHNNGVPARRIQKWLRHSDLETTLRYLACEDDVSSASTRRIVNTSFAPVCVPIGQSTATAA